ncbi:MAG: NAD(P)/FAD-dependent oxidoreductase [Phycisphaerales bacterium]
MAETADILVIGAGAAGLMAAIQAGRTLRSAGSGARVLVVDGARTLGAKILVAGGGRCNVTHHEVTEGAYAGGSRNTIRNVLRGFDVAATVRFFAELGVELKREETGKLFPVSDSARTVLNALLSAARDAGVEVRHPWRVRALGRLEAGYVATSETGGMVQAGRVILCAGGMALPKSGSDGHGYVLARSLGHTTTERIVPALVPLTLAGGFFTLSLSGLTLPTTLTVRASTGAKGAEFTGSTLLTHFGLSGPAALDISRYLSAARAIDAGTRLSLSFVPGLDVEGADDALRGLRVSPARGLTEPPFLLPERLARALCAFAGVDPSARPDHLKREARRGLAEAVCALVLPVTGDRGFTYAEVTAGGVPLTEIQPAPMASRVSPGLHLAGEILDVDGRIGGFNFQWAWASGTLAGRAAATGL